MASGRMGAFVAVRWTGRSSCALPAAAADRAGKAELGVPGTPRLATNANVSENQTTAATLSVVSEMVSRARAT